MTSVNLDNYWGVQLKGMRFDHARMAITMDLFWTDDGTPKEATLIFHAVTRCQLQAEKVFESEVVELISLEAKEAGGSLRITGELSNYAFDIDCAEVEEQLDEGKYRNGIRQFSQE